MFENVVGQNSVEGLAIECCRLKDRKIPVTTSDAYDDAQRLETLTHDLAGTADDQTLTFAHDPLGGIVSRTSANAAFDWDKYVAEVTDYTVNGLNQATARIPGTWG